MNNITRKISGLWIIIYTLMPVILITIFTITLLTIINDVKIIVSGPLNQIDTNLTQLQTNVIQVGDAIETSLEPIKKFNQDIQNAFEIIEQIPFIGDINITNFSDAFDNIPKIEELWGYSQQLLLEVDKSIKELQIIATKILNLIVIAGITILLLLVQLLIVPYIRWAHGRITRGWELICS